MTTLSLSLIAASLIGLVAILVVSILERIDKAKQGGLSSLISSLFNEEK